MSDVFCQCGFIVFRDGMKPTWPQIEEHLPRSERCHPANHLRESLIRSTTRVSTLLSLLGDRQQECAVLRGAVKRALNLLDEPAMELKQIHALRVDLAQTLSWRAGT